MRGLAILPSARWPLRRSSREEARLLARNDGSPRPDGVFRPEAERKLRQGLIEGIGRHNAERSVMDDIAAEPEREFPYERRPAGGPDTNAFRRIGPKWRPNPAPPTMPQPVLPVNARTVPVTVATKDPEALERAVQSLRKVDFDAVDEARKTEGATYAGVRAAWGRSPIGDDLAATWPGAGESGERSLDAWHEMCAVRYPGHDLNATFGDYTGMLGKANEITGTRGTSRWPLQALPAADPRWAALAAEALDTARWLGDDDPVQAAAYRRLHEYITAAPDCETAVRLAELAAEAGSITRKLPAAMREHAGGAA